MRGLQRQNRMHVAASRGKQKHMLFPEISRKTLARKQEVV
jgi:hypothetical protein